MRVTIAHLLSDFTVFLSFWLDVNAMTLVKSLGNPRGAKHSDLGIGFFPDQNNSSPIGGFSVLQLRSVAVLRHKATGAEELRIRRRPPSNIQRSIRCRERCDPRMCSEHRGPDGAHDNGEFVGLCHSLRHFLRRQQFAEEVITQKDETDSTGELFPPGFPTRSKMKLLGDHVFQSCHRP